MSVEFFDAEPPDSDTPVITFYVSGLDAIERIQQTDVERHAVLPGGSTAADTSGIQSGDIRLHGYWRGTKASDMASRLRDDAIDDTSVEKLTLQAGDSNGTVSSPYNGTYRIGDQSRVTQPDSKETTFWEYDLVLIED
jgi:hypothetical protein